MMSSQILMMCIFIIFAWVPERRLGTVLGIIFFLAEGGAIPNMFIERNDAVMPRQVHLMVIVLGALFMLVVIMDLKLLYTHPF